MADEDLVIAKRDYEKIADSCTRTGYVEGIEVGKDKGLKEGFVEGFISGMASCTQHAVLVGRMSAVKVWLDGKQLKSTSDTKLRDLREHIEKLRTLLKDFEEEAIKEREQLLEAGHAEYIRRVELHGKEDDSKDKNKDSDSCRTQESDTSPIDSHNAFIDLVERFPASTSVNKFSVSLNDTKGNSV